MSDFGSTLRSIIKVCGVKSYILADALGYDPSYLSKWLNNSKRPPAAMIDGTAEEIAKVCVHSGDTSAFEKLAEKLQYTISRRIGQDCMQKNDKEHYRQQFF